MPGLLDPQGAGNQETAGAGDAEAQAQGSGASVPEWLSGADESLKKSLAKFKEPMAVGRAYAELEKKLGSSVQIPKEDASPEEWGKFFSRIGRPDSPEKYELPKEVLTDELRAKLAKEAFEAGATPKMVKALVGTIVEDAKTREAEFVKKQEAEYNEAVGVLKGEYGAKFDENLALANKALTGLFPSAAKMIVERGLGNDPALIRDLVALGSRLGEDKLVSGAPAAKEAPHPYEWMRKAFSQE